MKKIGYNILLSIPLFFLLGTFNPGPGAENHGVPIASFSTSIADQDENVKRNIGIASEKLKGILISPGSIFSFNTIVGEGSSKNGFSMGRVMYRDSTAMEPGGGLCQVSSTLFNALLMAGCVIIERHRHFQPVAYVPVGLDATIKFGKKDLRMKNPHGYNLRIDIQANDRSLNAVITAERPLAYRYEIQTEMEDMPVMGGDDSDRIRQGITVHVYRKRFMQNRCIDSALLYRDFYPPVYYK